MKPNIPVDSASFAVRFASLATALAITGGHAQAQLTWNSAGPTNNWSTASGNENWLPGGVAWAQNSSAIFDAAAESINVTTANVFDNITFDVTGFIITSSGAGSFLLSNDFASTIAVTNGSDTATINDTIANNTGIPSSLTKTGAGTLILFGTAANTFSGGLSVSEGTLVASHEGALGSGPVTVASGATLDVNKGNVTFTGLSSSLSGGGTVRVTAIGTGNQTLNLNGNHSTFTGNLIVGVGAAAGSGKIQLNGADNAATAITVEPNATVFSSAGVHSASITLKGGDTGETLGQLRIDGAATVWAGPVILDGVMSGAGDGIVGSNAGPATISGVISELNGPRDLTKAGGGTLVLTNNNTYTGATRVLAGNLSVAAIGNTGNPGPIGTNATIALGNLATGTTLIYTGPGESTDRVIDLAGTYGNAGLNQSGTGVLNFTTAPTASGVGGKTLVLSGDTAGIGEISATIGNIFNNGGTVSTTASAAFLSGATSITVDSATDVVVGSTVSGTGITGAQRVTSITGAGPFTIGLSAGTNAAGTLGQAVTFTQPSAINKQGTGTWVLSGVNSYTGITNIAAGVLRITNNDALGSTAGLTRVVGDVGGLGRVEWAGDFTIAEPFLIGARQGVSLNVPALSHISGTTTLTAQLQGQLGGSTYNIESQSGLLTLAGGFTLSGGATGAGRVLQLQGAGDGIVSGEISNGSGTPTVNKQGTGTWTLSGPNTYTGATNVNGGMLVLAGTATNGSNRTVNTGTLVISGDYSGAGGTTTVNGGTLRLDYSNTDSSKLPESLLTLAGGTIELVGGSHAEVVASTTVTSGRSTLVTRTSGSARLDLRTVTSAGSGTVVLAQSGIATTDTLNTNGILPWARVLVGGSPVIGTNSLNDIDGPIVPYTAFSNVERLGPTVIPTGIANNVQIVDGGTAGNVGLSASPLTQINLLQMTAADGPSTVAYTNPTDVLMVGDEAGGLVWQSPGADSLTLGTAANDGILTTGNTDNATAATLNIINDSSAPLTANSTVANNASDPVSLVLGGSGNIVLAGNNTFTGTLVSTASAVLLSGSNNSLGGITVGGGTFTMSGNNSFSTALTVSSGATAILNGNNVGRPGNIATRTVVNGGGILQLQANAGNTAAGVSTVLSTEQTGTVQPFNLLNGGLLQLRSDDTVTFAGGNNAGGFNGATLGIDVDRVGAAATGQTLTFAPGTLLPFGNGVTFNITGANGYKLALGTFRNVTGTASNLTLNPTTADLLLGGYSNQQNNANNSTLTLAGTSSASEVTGGITNQSPSSTGTGIVNVVKNGSGTWSLSGANTYTGATTVNAGLLKVNNATALTTTSALTVAGTGAVDLNGISFAVANMGAGATTASLTDNSAGAGTTTLAINGQSNTIATVITDGPSKDIRMSVRNANASATPFTLTNANTFSGGLLLVNGTGSGTRLRITGAPVTVGSAGAIVSSPFGTGPITIGQAPTDKAGMLLDTAPNYTIANDIVFNTALGTDQPGIRLDTVGHTFSGTITANLSNALFGNVGSARLTGQVTGPNGLQLNASPVAITLANATASPNDYAGDTTIGAGATLSMGAADQIPNGAATGSVVANGTLNLAGFNQTINGLTGTGTVSSSTGSPTLSLGANNTSSTYPGNTGGTVGLNKIGSGFITMTGTIAHLGDTTVTQGTLAIVAPSTFADGADVRLNTGGTLSLAAGTDVIDQLFINGTPQATGKWGRLGSIAELGADFETSRINGDGLLNVTTSGTTPYGTWINAFFPGETNPAIIGQTADPDNDGSNNLTEFAFDGNPASGSLNPKVFAFTVDSDFDGDTDKELVLTAAIRTGAAVFTNAAPSTAASVADGITYRIEGSSTLASFPTTVNAVPTPITTALPALNPGYSYRSFSLGGSNGLPSRGFLRASVTAP
jgi:autotransporter-associated beta strand protein